MKSTEAKRIRAHLLKTIRKARTKKQAEAEIAAFLDGLVESTEWVESAGRLVEVTG